MKENKILLTAKSNYKQNIAEVLGASPTKKELQDAEIKLIRMSANTSMFALKFFSWIYKTLFPAFKTAYLSTDSQSNPLYLSNPRKPVVYISNHISNLDSLILGTNLFVNKFPYPIYASGENLFINKTISWLLKSFGAFKIKRSNSNQKDFTILSSYIAANIENAQAVMYFPEGSRSRNGALKSFKKGLTRSVINTFINNQFSSTIDDILFIPIGLAYSRVPEDIHFSGQKRTEAERSNLVKDFLVFRKDPIVSYMHVGKSISLKSYFDKIPMGEKSTKVITDEFSEYLRDALQKTIPILNQDIIHYVLDDCAKESNSDYINLPKLKKKYELIFDHISKHHGNRLVKAKHSFSDFINHLHERELLIVEKLKLKILKKDVIEYYSSKVKTIKEEQD